MGELVELEHCGVPGVWLVAHSLPSLSGGPVGTL